MFQKRHYCFCRTVHHEIEYLSKKSYDCVTPKVMDYGKTCSLFNTKECKKKSMIERATLLDFIEKSFFYLRETPGSINIIRAYQELDRCVQDLEITPLNY